MTGRQTLFGSWADIFWTLSIAILTAILVGVLFAFMLLAGSTSSGATWKPEYASAQQSVQDWYRNAKLTEAAQRRFSFTKCCDHADVFRTQFRVDRDTGADAWFYLADGDWKRVPDDIIHWGEHAPDGRPTLFIYNGAPTCFFPGDGGI